MSKTHSMTATITSNGAVSTGKQAELAKAQLDKKKPKADKK